MKISYICWGRIRGGAGWDLCCLVTLNRQVFKHRKVNRSESPLMYSGFTGTLLTLKVLFCSTLGAGWETGWVFFVFVFFLSHQDKRKMESRKAILWKPFSMAYAIQYHCESPESSSPLSFEFYHWECSEPLCLPNPGPSWARGQALSTPIGLNGRWVHSISPRSCSASCRSSFGSTVSSGAICYNWNNGTAWYS